MSVKGNKLRKQLANLFDKIAYQLRLGSLAYVRRTERIHPPALKLAARDQRADADDLMERVLSGARVEAVWTARTGDCAVTWQGNIFIPER